MSPRPLVVVCALTAGDFLLWNWSLSANQAVLALVSGLTLPPLAAASVLLLVLTAARLASRVTLLTVRPAMPETTNFRSVWVAGLLSTASCVERPKLFVGTSDST